MVICFLQDKDFEYFAHRAILATRCEYFGVRLNLTDFVEADEQRTGQHRRHNGLREVQCVRIDQTDPCVWPLAIDWMYTDRFHSDPSTETLVEVRYTLRD